MQNLRQALTEIRQSLDDSPPSQEMREMIDKALGSGDTGRMKAALNQFDNMGTVRIQRMRKDDE